MRTWKDAFSASPSEFEVQAELYRKLKVADCVIRGEVLVDMELPDELRARFDLVVFRKTGEPVAIVEVKNSNNPAKLREKWQERESRQIKKYKVFGIPMLFCLSMDEIPKTVSDLMDLLSNSEYPSPSSPYGSPSYSPSIPPLTHTPSPTPRRMRRREETTDLFTNGEQFSSEIWEEFMKIWNGTFVLPKIVSMRGRERTLRILMLDDFFKSHWREGIRRVAASRFCRGENSRKWKATVDWFLRLEVLPKVLEGKYDNHETAELTHEDQQFTQEEF